MTALVAALGGVELPRQVDADSTGIAILLELCTDIDATVGGHLRISGVEDVVDKKGYAEALIFEKLATQPYIDIT